MSHWDISEEHRVEYDSLVERHRDALAALDAHPDVEVLHDENLAASNAVFRFFMEHRIICDD